MVLHHQNLQLHLISTPHKFQILHFVITGNGIVDTEAVRGLQVKELDYQQGVVLSGKGPVWLFAYLAHLCHPAAWVAIFDPRLGGVVVQNHIAQGPDPGTRIPLEDILPYLNTHSDPSPRPAPPMQERFAVVAIVGPPHSGKSVFLHALQKDLDQRMGSVAFQRKVFLLRGAPDGEGNWFHDTPSEVAQIIRRKGEFDDAFVQQVVAAIRGIRSSKDLVFVDCGGKIDRRNQIIWNECTHAIIVSKEPNLLQQWRGAVQASGVDVLAEVLSTTHPSQQVISEEPLRLQLGPLERHSPSVNLPGALLERIFSIAQLQPLHP